MPWFLLYPLIGAALGAGGAKATGRDWKKGAMLGAGAGLTAGALPILGGAGAGGSAGWSSLIGATKAPGITQAALAGGASPTVATAAGQAAIPTGMNTFGSMLGKTAAPLLSNTGAAGSAAKGATLGSTAKQALVTSGVTGALGTAMPKYGLTQNMVDPGFMPAPPDPVEQLNQLMQKRRI